MKEFFSTWGQITAAMIAIVLSMGATFLFCYALYCAYNFVAKWIFNAREARAERARRRNR